MTSPSEYANAVVAELGKHFPDLADPTTAEVVADLVEGYARDPQPTFNVIVDDPISAKWRLMPDQTDRRRVHLTCYRMHPREADTELERTVNDALRALEASQ